MILQVWGSFYKDHPLKKNNEAFQQINRLHHPKKKRFTSGRSLNYPFWGDQTMQIYDMFQGFPQNNGVSGWWNFKYF